MRFGRWLLVVWVLLVLPACSSDVAPSAKDVLDHASDSISGGPSVEFRALPAYGEAPLETTLSWKIHGGLADEHSCQIDIDGDGNFDEFMTPCPENGSRTWKYVERGEYRPLLLVTDSSGFEVARNSLRVFSNELVLSEEVTDLDESGAFVGFETNEDTVMLRFQGDRGAAVIEPGTILLSKVAGGLLVRVISVVETSKDEVVVTAGPAGLDEVIKEGFWGATSIAETSVVESVRSALQLEGRSDWIDIDDELSTPVVSFSPSVSDIETESGVGTLTVKDIGLAGKAQAGINTLLLKKELLSPLHFDVSVWLNTRWAFDAGIVGALGEEWERELPEIPLGMVLAGPVPITFDLEPALFGSMDIEASFGIGTDGYLHAMGGASNFTGEVVSYGDAEFDSDFTLDPAGLMVSGSAKAGLSLRLKVQVVSMLGPWLEAGGYVKADFSLTPDEYCAETSLGIEGAAGGEFEFFTLVEAELSYPFDIAEWPLWSDCFPQDCVPDCSGLDCGLDPVCGSSCGTCDGGKTCQTGQCIQVHPNCPTDKDCSGLDCGPDPVCGESCGECDDGEGCQSGQCVQVDPDCPEDRDCTDISCGPDPVCGESCGICDFGANCQDGQCISEVIDGIWSDPTTGLSWMIDPAPAYHGWESAKATCNSVVQGGHDDWRLPDIGELRSLIRGCPSTASGSSTCNVEPGGCLNLDCIDEEQCSSCLPNDGPADGIYWPQELNGNAVWYWSSTTVGDSSDLAWNVCFENAFVSTRDKLNQVRIRCVRSFIE